jgi:hypothetical protein
MQLNKEISKKLERIFFFAILKVTDEAEAGARSVSKR